MIDSLLVYLIESIKKEDRFKENKFSYKQLEGYLTHYLRINKTQVFKLIQEMCKTKLLIKNEDAKPNFYNINFNVEEEFIFKINQDKYNEYTNNMYLSNERRNSKNGKI